MGASTSWNPPGLPRPLQGLLYLSVLLSIRLITSATTRYFICSADHQLRLASLCFHISAPNNKMYTYAHPEIIIRAIQYIKHTEPQHTQAMNWRSVQTSETADTSPRRKTMRTSVANFVPATYFRCEFRNRKHIRQALYRVTLTLAGSRNVYTSWPILTAGRHVSCTERERERESFYGDFILPVTINRTYVLMWSARYFCLIVTKYRVPRQI
jgi:hypothetical protein